MLGRIILLLNLGSFGGTVAFSTLFAALLSWTTWYTWKFIIRPVLRPNEPKILPYWIPSHAGAFFKDSHKLMRYAVSRLGSKEPFSLCLAGETYYVITSPPDTTTYFSDVVSLTWDGFLNEVLVAFGCNPARLDELWKRNPPSQVNPAGKSLIHLTEDLYKQQLHPGPKLDLLIDTYRRALKQLTSWDRLSFRHGFSTSSQKARVSLYDLCSNTMIDASQMALFDPILFAIEPNMTENLRFFTDELWKLLHPSVFIDSVKIQSLLQQYTRAFRIYQRLPKEKRSQETWVVQTILDQYKELEINEIDSAAMLVMIYWTGDANAYKAVFWIMSYILFDAELHEIIKEETRPAVNDNGDLDIPYLAENCPRLTSLYQEVLRLTKRDNVFRRVTRDMEIAGKTLHAPNPAIIPTCQLHDNAAVYGDDVHLFDPDRFLKDPDLTGNASYRPYGGGRNYCPGRFFAMQEIFSFVALMLNYYDIQLSDSPRKQEFPLQDEGLFTLGISRPLPGSEVFVTLSNK